jgi:hypothetical protein
LYTHNNIWDNLHNYEACDLVKDRYQKKHGREANTQRAKEICASFAQAREYFKNSESVNDSIKSLLIYYGVLSLSRGTIIFLNGNSEATLSQSHGLATLNWQESLSKPLNLGGVTTKVQENGTFRELAKATNNSCLSRLNSNGLTHKISYDKSLSLLPNYVFTLDDIISRIPELLEYYLRFNQNANCFAQHIGVPSPDEKACFIWDRIDTMLGIGATYSISCFKDNLRLSKLLATYILSYKLGMITRYFPYKWMSIINNEKASKYLPIIKLAIRYIEIQYPKMIFDILEEDSYLLTTVDGNL